MRQRKRNMMIFFLASVLTISALAGCTGKKESVQNSQPSEQNVSKQDETVEAKTSTEESPESVSEAAPLPLMVEYLTPMDGTIMTKEERLAMMEDFASPEVKKTDGEWGLDENGYQYVWPENYQWETSLFYSSNAGSDYESYNRIIASYYGAPFVKYFCYDSEDYLIFGYRDGYEYLIYTEDGMEKYCKAPISKIKDLYQDPLLTAGPEEQFMKLDLSEARLINEDPNYSGIFYHMVGGDGFGNSLKLEIGASKTTEQIRSVTFWTQDDSLMGMSYLEEIFENPIEAYDFDNAEEVNEPTLAARFQAAKKAYLGIWRGAL